MMKIEAGSNLTLGQTYSFSVTILQSLHDISHTTSDLADYLHTHTKLRGWHMLGKLVSNYHILSYGCDNFCLLCSVFDIILVRSKRLHAPMARLRG